MSGGMLLRLNPELQRQLWLELTPARLLVMPVLSALLLGGMYTLRGEAGMTSTALLATTVLLVLWGSRLAADSFAAEVADRTWDIQRLSSTSPTALALGKLIGGTSSAWYGAAFFLAAYMAYNAQDTALRVVTAVVQGLVAQSAALFVALLLHRQAASARGNTTVAQIMGILAGLFTGAPSAVPSPFYPFVTGNLNIGTPAPMMVVSWMGVAYPRAEFVLVVRALFGVWLVVGAIALIRREVGFRGGPLAWTLFMVYAVVLVAGFAHGGTDTMVWLPLSALLVATAMAYAALFATPLGVTQMKRIGFAVRSESLLAVWRELPPWVPNVVVAIAADLALIFRAALAGTGPGAHILLEPTMLAGLLGLFVRDVLLVCAVRLSFGRRTMLLLLVVFLLLYWLLPTVLTHVGATDPRQIFLPQPQTTYFGVVGPWVQAALAVLPLWWFYRRRRTVRAAAP